MRTIALLEDQIIFSVLKPFLGTQEHVCLIAHGATFDDKDIVREGIEIFRAKTITAQSLFRQFDLSSEDRLIMCFRDTAKLKKCLEKVIAQHDDVPIVVITTDQNSHLDMEHHENIFPIAIEAILTNQLTALWKKIDNRRKLAALLEINREAENVLILIQDDPDPDALAGGLALRVLLGRNKQTAPIATFGQVTRSENLNMIKLLDIPVMKIAAEDLATFSRIALVDVQPPYFHDVAISADIVLDHHPYDEYHHVPFSDVRIPYGATSTILAEYLIDGGYKITQRLATALVYGIKTDTMFLGRGISPADIEVFTYLYSMANLNMLRQIEHATLEYDEISSFVKALKNARVLNNTMFAHLGRVDREDIIARLSDFCLQIGGAEWSVVSGIFQNNIVCSIRNVGYVKHAGELVSRVFNDIGTAGGHRSMAKVVVPVAAFKRHFGIRSVKEIAPRIVERFLAGMI